MATVKNMAKSTQKGAMGMLSSIPLVKKDSDLSKGKIQQPNEKDAANKNDDIASTSIAQAIQEKIKKENPAKGKISGYIEAGLLEEFKQTCKNKGLKLSDVLEQLIRIYISE